MVKKATKKVVSIDSTKKNKSAAGTKVYHTPGRSAIISAYGETASPLDSMPTQRWEELESIYQGIASGILSIANNIREHIAQIQTVENQNNTALVNMVNTTFSDIQIFTDALMKIRQRHQGKTGLVKDGTENSECIAISIDYYDLHDRFNALTFNTMAVLTDHLAELYARQDPKAVEDIEMKDIPIIQER